MKRGKKASVLKKTIDMSNRDDFSLSEDSGDYLTKYISFEQAKRYWKNNKVVKLGMQLELDEYVKKNSEILESAVKEVGQDNESPALIDLENTYAY